MQFDRNTLWALVGPGAIGLYYGGLLAKGGVSLHVLGRSDCKSLEADGIRLRIMEPQTGQLKDEYCIRPQQVVKESSAIGSVDVVLIAAKSTVNEALVGSLHPLVEPGRTVILILQNGMGNAEFFAKHFTDNPILVGMCFAPVNRIAPGVVENYLPGGVEIGSLEGRWLESATAVVTVFKTAGIKADVSLVLEASLWRKLCWNVPFNGLSIVCGGVTTDQILSDLELQARAHRLIGEMCLAASLAGSPIPDGFLQTQFDMTAKMGAYRPSSLIDFLNGRPVEIESIWGEPLRRGRALGLEMLELTKLYEELCQVVRSRQ